MSLLLDPLLVKQFISIFSSEVNIYRITKWVHGKGKTVCCGKCELNGSKCSGFSARMRRRAVTQKQPRLNSEKKNAAVAKIAKIAKIASNGVACPYSSRTALLHNQNLLLLQ
jgi:hypothetical protein